MPGPQEGTYSVHPSHMRVAYPANADDGLLTASHGQCNLPLSVPTSMSSFIQRIKLADICRTIVDTLPSTLLSPQELDYDVVLGLNARLQDFVKGLPLFFQLDAASIQQSREICSERPYIAWQRKMIHFSVHTRICRLHRPFLVEALFNPKYAFSRMTCIKSAQAVLELRRSMDDLEASRFSTAMQHVFMAAVILATNACFDATDPHFDARKMEVLDACKMLEKSQQESAVASRGIQRGIETLRAMLQRHKGKPSGGSTPALASSGSLYGADDVGTPRPDDPRPGTDAPSAWDVCAAPRSVALGDDNRGWEELWDDFFNVAPGFDMPHWNSLLTDMDFSLGPD